jgi:hypothetical protein
MRQIKSSLSDTVYFPSMLGFLNEERKWDSIPIQIRARGNFRRKNCNFPPLRIKIRKKDAKNTLFEGNRSLKLVLPCQTGASYNVLILKEYICYQLYEPATPYTFNTRLLNIRLTDEAGKTDKVHTLRGFFIEDDDVVADRFQGKINEDIKIHPLKLHDTSAVKHDFFQFMIGNTDWSALGSHNIKTMVRNGRQFIPLAYDFDMAGLVNAPYASTSELLEIKSVRERLYRGFCRDKQLFEFIRQHYLSMEPKIMEVLNLQGQSLDPRELKGMTKFLEEFFEILKNDGSFKTNIVNACRTK